MNGCQRSSLRDINKAISRVFGLLVPRALQQDAILNRFWTHTNCLENWIYGEKTTMFIGFRNLSCRILSDKERLKILLMVLCFSGLKGVARKFEV